jgi:tetratricopeptide (TPR) repeat protein
MKKEQGRGSPGAFFPKALILTAIAGLILFIPPVLRTINSSSLCRRADFLAASCLWPQALGKYNEALELRPDYTRAILGKAEVHLKTGSLREAEAVCEEALKRRPGERKLLLALAEVLGEEGRVNKALKILMELASSFPEDSETALALSHSWALAGQPAKGAGILEKAVFADMQNAELHYRLALLLQSIPGASNLNRAIDEYQQALKWNFRMNRAAWNLAELYGRLGKLDEVISEARLALENAPNDIALLNLLGMSLYEAGKLPEAESLFRKITLLDPDFRDSFLSLARVLKMQKKSREAVSVYKTILGENPCLPAALVDMGEIMHSLGRNEEALRWYQRALRCAPRDPSLKNVLRKLKEHLRPPVRLLNQHLMRPSNGDASPLRMQKLRHRSACISPSKVLRSSQRLLSLK